MSKFSISRPTHLPVTPLKNRQSDTKWHPNSSRWHSFRLPKNTNKSKIANPPSSKGQMQSREIVNAFPISGFCFAFVYTLNIHISVCLYTVFEYQILFYNINIIIKSFSIPKIIVYTILRGTSQFTRNRKEKVKPNTQQG